MVHHRVQVVQLHARRRAARRCAGRRSVGGRGGGGRGGGALVGRGEAGRRGRGRNVAMVRRTALRAAARRRQLLGMQRDVLGKDSAARQSRSAHAGPAAVRVAGEARPDRGAARALPPPR